mmetsp:Transcript_45628/g.97482  ORF Transcript_45628/g.97482 Transcript_45628/m.97482 type:complete len:241 (+) Transcript_45628:91-813(+)
MALPSGTHVMGSDGIIVTMISDFPWNGTIPRRQVRGSGRRFYPCCWQCGRNLAPWEPAIQRREHDPPGVGSSLWDRGCCQHLLPRPSRPWRGAVGGRRSGQIWDRLGRCGGARGTRVARAWATAARPHRGRIPGGPGATQAQELGLWLGRIPESLHRRRFLRPRRGTLEVGTASLLGPSKVLAIPVRLQSLWGEWPQPMATHSARHGRKDGAAEQAADEKHQRDAGRWHLLILVGRSFED